jgi:hypothetical protein
MCVLLRFAGEPPAGDNSTMSKFDDAYLRMQQFGNGMLGCLADFKKEIDEIRAGKVKVPTNCPSRASMIDTFHLSKIQVGV